MCFRYTVEHGSYDISRDRPKTVGSSVLSDKNITVYTTFFVFFFQKLPRLIRHFLKFYSGPQYFFSQAKHSHWNIQIRTVWWKTRKERLKYDPQICLSYIPIDTFFPVLRRNVGLTEVKIHLPPSKICWFNRVIV